MQSEVSQKEKNKYCTPMHIHNLEKNGTEGQGRDRDADIVNRRVHGEGRGEVRETGRLRLTYIHYIHYHFPIVTYGCESWT